MVGRQATLVQDSDCFHPGWFVSDVPTISGDIWQSLLVSNKLSPSSNIVIVPETYLSQLSDYARYLPVVIFNQNGSYTFGLPSSKLFKPSFVLDRYLSGMVKHVLCVSQYDFSLLSEGLGVSPSKLSIIANGIETDFFKFEKNKKFIASYMPRKNTSDSLIVSSLLRNKFLSSRWNFVPIVNSSHVEVVSQLQKSLVFLSFGHPEGFGLPVAEAMACGAAVVGYSGLGGKELFNIARKFGLDLEVSYGDWLGFVLQFSNIDSFITNNSSKFSSSVKSISDYVRKYYSLDAMAKSVFIALDRIEKSL